jgi:putative ABC transport system permease protein
MNTRPPRLPDKLLEWFCAPEVIETLQGDLHELYQQRLGRNPKWIADMLFFFDVISACRPFAFKTEFRRTSSMFPHYVKMSIRSMARNKGYAWINIFGLSIAVTCCLLIMLYANDELTYDRFHPRASDIYRLMATGRDPRGIRPMWDSGTTGMTHAPVFKSEISEIEDFVRLQAFTFTAQKDGEWISEQALYVDNGFFSVFSFPLLQGDPATALAQPNSVVLTSDVAFKYFGNTDAIGKTLVLFADGQPGLFTVTAVAKPAPENSTIKFGMLIPFAHYELRKPGDHWLNFFINSFVVLRPGSDPVEVEEKLERVHQVHGGPQIKQAAEEWGFRDQITFGLQPLTNIHLNPDIHVGGGLVDGSNPMYSRVLMIIGAFILAIACINFVNFSIAQSSRRSKEVGVRKVTGSARGQLIRQFLGESAMVCVGAFTVAIVLTRILLPFFNRLTGKNLSPWYLTDGNLVACSVILLVLTTLAAGAYPAFVFSSWRPVDALTGKQKVAGRNYLANGLVLAQFLISTFLVTCTIVIYLQFDFMMNKDLGYDDKNLVRISLPWWRGNNAQMIDLFRSKLERETGVVRMAAKNGGRTGIHAKINNRDVGTDLSLIDPSFLPTMGIQLAAGRNFSEQFPSDTSNSVLVNEAFVRAAGLDNPVGTTIEYFNGGKKKVIVGVVRDYHFRSLREEIGPQLYACGDEMKWGQIWLKLKPEDIPATMETVRKVYKELIANYPYDYQFMDVMNAQMYESENNWKEIVQYAAILSILISSVGLFGLTSLVIAKRTKEIAVRKVLGASASIIAFLLSRNFLLLMLIAFGLALPLAQYAANEWLASFAYRVQLYWWLHPIVWLVVLIVVLVTTSLQVFRTAASNPAKSLRSE